MKNPDVRWVLAFDASCGRCREISDLVSQECGEVLEVLPFAHPDVRRWLEQADRTAEPPAPTLIEIDRMVVRTWTGPAMGIRLARWLGVRSTIRLLTALGQWQRQASSRPSEKSDRRLVGRSHFLRLGAGFVAAGAILTGKTPAYAARQSTQIQAWLEANRARLPERYEELVTHPMASRKAIYRTLEPAARSRVWLDHLKTYRAGHLDLSAEQRRVQNQAVMLAARTSSFAADDSASPGEALEALRRAAIEAFGKDNARGPIATLGDEDGPSVETVTPMFQECDCNVESDWCISNCLSAYCYTSYRRCDCTGSGCGTFWAYACNGC